MKHSPYQNGSYICQRLSSNGQLREYIDGDSCEQRCHTVTLPILFDEKGYSKCVLGNHGVAPFFFSKPFGRWQLKGKAKTYQRVLKWI